jgi:hypothetical protein
MIFGLLLPVILLAVIILIVLKVTIGGRNRVLRGQSIRRFFQYLLLYVLIVLSVSGLSGLLGRLLDHPILVTTDQTVLARSVSFVVVGIPLYILLALWTRRKFVSNHLEMESFGWGLYVSAVAITSLVMTMFALHDILAWAVGIQIYSGSTIARFILWGAIWGAHFWLSLHRMPTTSSRFHNLVGSLIGLGTVLFGLSNFLATLIERILKLNLNVLYNGNGDPIKRSAVTLAVGIPVWFLYWFKTYAKSKHDSLWVAYVLLFGVGGGLVIALSSSSMLLYRVLVWFLGDPKSVQGSLHYQNIPNLAAAACVGIIFWWYHRAILETDTVRTEIRRIYEYLMSGIGLMVAAAGFTTVLISIIEAISRGAVIAGGSGDVNTLLAGVTLLLVGTPVWSIFWRQIQAAVQKFPVPEFSSPTRRIYLFLLFGIVGLISVIVLIIGVFLLFDDIFRGAFGVETFRRIRYALATLIATGVVAAYHWTIYRVEKAEAVAGLRGPRFVLLIGPKNSELIRAVEHLTGGRVESWEMTHDDGDFGPMENVLSIVERSGEESIILLAGTDGIRTIPVDI